jgi:copper chaperone CopZ
LALYRDSLKKLSVLLSSDWAAWLDFYNMRIGFEAVLRSLREQHMLLQRNHWAILCLAHCLAGCAEHGAVDNLQPTHQPVFNASRWPTVVFALPDMMCEEGCAEAVEDILAVQPGIEDVRVDFEAKSATVAINAQSFDSQQVIAALVDKGFDNSTLATNSVAATDGSDAKRLGESDTAAAD